MIIAECGSAAALRRSTLDHARPLLRLPQILGDGTTADFFFIDTNPFVTAYRGTKVRIDGQDTAGQLAWLARKLAASTAAWRIVVGHHPMYTATSGHSDTLELIGQLAPMLENYGVHAYLCGHLHNLQQTAVVLRCRRGCRISNSMCRDVFRPSPPEPAVLVGIGHGGSLGSVPHADLCMSVRPACSSTT